ncbi:MAG: hypothetical protein AAGM33_05875, partial [Pseudomonadota bacterium]
GVPQMTRAAPDTRRAPRVSALGDLDALYMKRLDSEFSDSQPGGAALIGQSRNQVIAQVAMQQKKIDELKAALR